MTRILIADDSAVTRKALRTILDNHSEWTVCGEAANGRKALLMADELKPDMVILDLAMPMLDGFRSAAEIVKILPSVPILIYTLHDLPQMELEAKKFGVRAVVSKAADQSVLVETVERLLVDSPGPQLRGSGAESQAMPVSSQETHDESHSEAAADPPIEAS
jgi:NarL family two-component system response regulator YdfI